LAARFWLINTKVDKKIASTDAAVARMTNDRSKRGAGGNQAQVGADPDDHDQQVQIDEGHAAAECGNRQRHSLLQRRLGGLVMLALTQSLDVAGQGRVEAIWLRRRHRRADGVSL
jgi:soluble lytic murein transglycosylase-like protein